TTTVNSNITSGKPANSSGNLFLVEAEKGDMLGKKRMDNASVDIKNMRYAEDFIGQKGTAAEQVFSQSLQLKTQRAINFSNMRPRECDLAVPANSFVVNSQ